MKSKRQLEKIMHKFAIYNGLTAHSQPWQEKQVIYTSVETVQREAHLGAWFHCQTGETQPWL